MKSLLDKINAKLSAQGGFLKAISILVGGTAFAQGIAILVLPILTRLYTPEEFSLFSIYSSLLLILSVASCLRFEIAIPITESDGEAIHLVLIALLSNLIISLLIGLIIWIFHADIILLLGQPDFLNLIWLVPLGIFISGFYNVLQYWATRKKEFTVIAKSRVVQSISGSSVQLGMGLIEGGALGLIIGQIIKVSAGVRRLTINFWNEASGLVKDVKLKQLKQVFKENDQFPKYSALEALINSIAIYLPVIIIAAVTVDPEAGFLMLAMQIMTIPTALIGRAVAQVYLAHSAEKKQTGTLLNYTYECVIQLIKIGVIPLLVIGLMAPILVPLIFGDGWYRTGEMILWMLPWFIMQFIVSPISMSLHIINCQKSALLLQVFGLLLRVGGMIVVGFFWEKYIFEYYALSGFIFYLVYLFTIIFLLKKEV